MINVIKKNASIIIVVAVLLALAGAILGINYLNRTSYVATIAGEKITVAEYNFFLAAVKQEMELEADESSREGMWNNPALVEDAKKKALNMAKEFEIQVMKAKERNYTLSSDDAKEVDNMAEYYLNQLMSNLQYSGVDSSKIRSEAEKQFKNSYRVSIKQYKKILSDFMLVYKLADEEQEKLTATEEEIKSHYDKNSDNFIKTTLRHILFFTVDEQTGLPFEEDKIKEIEKKANETLEKIKSGEDMATLAKDLSEDVSTKDSGGELPPLEKNGYFPELWDWSIKSKVNDVGVVKVSYGYHVVRLEKVTTFEDVKENVKSVVLSDKYEELVKEWAKDPKYDVEENGNIIAKIKI